jgi:hypothetical protein
MIWRLVYFVQIPLNPSAFLVFFETLILFLVALEHYFSLMEEIENQIQRLPELGKWFVDIYHD